MDGYQVNTATLRQCADTIQQQLIPDLTAIENAISDGCTIPDGAFILVGGGAEAYGQVLSDTKNFIEAVKSRYTSFASKLEAAADGYDQGAAQNSQAVSAIPGH